MLKINNAIFKIVSTYSKADASKLIGMSSKTRAFYDLIVLEYLAKIERTGDPMPFMTDMEILDLAPMLPPPLVGRYMNKLLFRKILIEAEEGNAYSLCRPVQLVFSHPNELPR